MSQQPTAKSSASTPSWRFWAVVWGTVVVLALFFPAGGTGIRAPVAATRAHLRELATALESYYVDQQVDPPGTAFSGTSADLVMLTTPFAYLERVPGEYNPARPKRPEDVLSQLVLAAGAIVWVLVSLAYGLHAKQAHARDAWQTWGICTTVYTALLALGVWTGHGDPVVLAAAITFVVSLGDVGRPTRLLRKVVVPAVVLVAVAIELWGMDVDRTLRPEVYADLPFQYATNGVDRWILVARGPDGEFDLEPMDYIRAATEPFWFHEPYPGVLFIYDPSNGTESSGDIVRCGP